MVRFEHDAMTQVNPQSSCAPKHMIYISSNLEDSVSDGKVLSILNSQILLLQNDLHSFIVLL